MKPYYWNQEYYESLLELAESLRSDPQLSMLAEFCQFQEKGLRKEAINVSKEFVDSTVEWSESERRAAVDKLFTIRYDPSKNAGLINYPILEGLVRPTLDRWLEEDPDHPVALRWQGLLLSDMQALKRALAIAPDDFLVRQKLVSMFLYGAYYDMHHLHEGHFLGDETETEEWLQQASTLISGADDPALFVDERKQYENLFFLLQDWLEYKNRPVGTFPEWCAQRGKKHGWTRAYYYI